MDLDRYPRSDDGRDGLSTIQIHCLQMQRNQITQKTIEQATLFYRIYGQKDGDILR